MKQDKHGDERESDPDHRDEGSFREQQRVIRDDHNGRRNHDIADLYQAVEKRVIILADEE